MNANQTSDNKSAITKLFILSSGSVFFCEVNCKVSAVGLHKILQKNRLLHVQTCGWSLLIILCQILTARMNFFFRYEKENKTPTSLLSE